MQTEKEETWLTQVRKGLLEMCILNFLQKDKLYGYEIVKRLTEIHHLVVSEGTVYPIMSRLKKEGYLKSQLQESPLGPVRKYYTLTALGKKRVKMLNHHWSELNKTITRIATEVS